MSQPWISIISEDAKDNGWLKMQPTLTSLQINFEDAPSPVQVQKFKCFGVNKIKIQVFLWLKADISKAVSANGIFEVADKAHKHCQYHQELFGKIMLT